MRCRVLDRRLARALRQAEQLDPSVGIGGDDLVRAVRRGVRDDKDLRAVGRVVEAEQALQSPADRALFVVNRDGYADRRPISALLAAEWATRHAAYQVKQRRIN